MAGLSLIAALCAGFSCGCLAFFAVKCITSVELEKHKMAVVKRVPLVFKAALPFLSITRPLARSKSFALWRKSEQTRLDMAGYSILFTAEDFVAIKLLYYLIALIIIFMGALSGKVGIPFVMAILIAIYPGVWMKSTIKARQLSIMKALPNLLDLLTLSVESGRDLVSSLRDILARRRPDALGEELVQAFSEIQLGRKRSEALKAMADRVRQIDLSATVNAICQADELGVSIGQQLRIQSDMQRQKRFSLAEKLANEASVKIIVPVVIFILPAVFIILLGPLLLQTARMFR